MATINYIVAILFTLLWAIGFFSGMAGYAIHFLLLAAFALILINILHYNNSMNPKNKQLKIN